MYAANMRIKSYSFPSSHAYASALGAMYISTAISHPIVSALLIGSALVVGLSRVGVGAHYPSDVIGGWALAVLVFYSVGLA